MDETFARTRCLSCGKGLKFEEWSRGREVCGQCGPQQRATGRAAAFVCGPQQAPASARLAVASQHEAYERMLDEVPDELIDEIVSALEQEAEQRQPAATGAEAAVRDVLDEIGFGRSPREVQWTAWGFSGGFALNVGLAKYAQMSTSAPMSEFIVPLLLGGAVAGLTCGAIGWGLAKLSDR